MHEETQKIRDCVEGQKVGEKCASENRVETQARRQENRVETKARRQEGSRRDWHGLNGVQPSGRIHSRAKWASSATRAFSRVALRSRKTFWNEVTGSSLLD